ncbi:MAG: hypothetical protein LBU32_33050 [Clostridiales bacterium]|jgi:hypothetical protein|nr:hypothetical protein [Clostridiales bacterium]
MSTDQVIYTSCKRGRDGVSDGQQIYSYSAGFSDAGNDEVRMQFGYPKPNYPGEITEELIAGYPKRFQYKRLSDGRACFALGTYLGRDYMGSAGRLGNFLCHVVICGSDDIDFYPIELYKNGMLRERMEFNEVNNPQKPDYLPKLELEPGFVVSKNSIIEFLGYEGNLDTFKTMLRCFLAYARSGKRVVICDDPDNIAMWIGALSYVFPLSASLGIPFSTYEYDPEYTISRVLGVIPEYTAYACDMTSKNHYVFDKYSGYSADVDLVPCAESYINFIELGMSLAYEAIESFNEFISERFECLGTDERWYSAYALYSLILDGVESATDESIALASSLVMEVGNSKSKFEFASAIAEDKGLTSLSSDKLMFVARKAFDLYDYLSSESLRKLINAIINGLIIEFSKSAQDQFESFREDASQMLSKVNIKINSEFMASGVSEKFIQAAKQGNKSWKWSFAASTIYGYAKEKKLPVAEMHPDRPTGALLAELVAMVFKADYAEARKMILDIIDSRGYKYEDIIDLAYNFEGLLLELPGSRGLIAELWRHATKSALRTGANPLRIADMFLYYERFELVIGLFEDVLAGSSNASAMRIMLDNFLSIKKTSFVEENRSKLLALYYESLSRLPLSETAKAYRELLYRMIKNSLVEPFSLQVIERVISSFPYSKLSQEEVSLLCDASRYVTSTLHKSMPQKMVHLVVGRMFAEADNVHSLNAAIKNSKDILADNPFDLSKLSDKNLDEYLGWILEGIVVSSRSHTDLLDSFDIFGVRGNIKADFIRKLSETWHNAHKKVKGFDADLIIIAFMLSCGTAKDRENFGKSLSTKGKKELEELDDAFRGRYASNARLIAYWDSACEIGAKTNALMYGLGKLLRKNK